MAAPPKPWERGSRFMAPGVYPTAEPNVILNQRLPPFHPGLEFSPQNTGGGGGVAPADVRPPLPPRPTASSNAVSRPYYSNYSSYSPYNNYSPYSSYGGPVYGGYNRYGSMGGGLPDDNRFIQVAEDSSRQAFQSIESIVHAFGTVSMMLESTYHAVYSSFRAVLGVAEHFSRMKSHFAQIFSALAVVRTLKWILKKLLYIIGLRSQDPSLEAAWRNAASSAASSLTEADLKQSRSSWPIVMFFAVVCGGPYVIWHVLSSLVASDAPQKTQGWRNGIGEHYAAVSLYSFQAATKKELSFQTGQNLFLAPKDLQPQVRGWLLASNGKEMGLVPANYIKILGLQKRSTPQGSANASSVTGARVFPGIPSVCVLKQGEESSSPPGTSKNSDPVVLNHQSSSDVLAKSCRTEVRKQDSLLDSDIPWQLGVKKQEILPPEVLSVQNKGGQETSTNTEGPERRPGVSGQEVDGASASLNMELTEKSVFSGELCRTETAQIRLTPDPWGEIRQKEDLVDMKTIEQEMRNDSLSSRASFGEMQYGSSSTVDQLVHVPASDNTQPENSSQIDMEGGEERVCTEKTSVCHLDEK